MDGSGRLRRDPRGIAPGFGAPCGGAFPRNPHPWHPTRGVGPSPIPAAPTLPLLLRGGDTGAPQTAATRAGAKLSGGHGAVRGRDPSHLHHLQPGGARPSAPPAGLATPLGRPRPAPQRPRTAPGPGSSEEPLIGGRRDFYFKSTPQFFGFWSNKFPQQRGKGRALPPPWAPLGNERSQGNRGDGGAGRAVQLPLQGERVKSKIVG